MNQTAFDASGFVRFDLSSGRIRSAADESLALVPRRLLALLKPGPDLLAAAREWGGIHGGRFARAGREAPVEALADSLGGVLAVAGLGRVTIETRGDALLVRAAATEPAGGAGDAPAGELLLGFVAGFLTAVDPDGFDVIELSESGGERLLWAGGPEAVARVRGWLAEGEEPLRALDRLSRGGEQ